MAATAVTEALAMPAYGFSTQAIALSFLAPLVSAIIGELMGDWFDDCLEVVGIQRHHRVYVLKNRLLGSMGAILSSPSTL